MLKLQLINVLRSILDLYNMTDLDTCETLVNSSHKTKDVEHKTK